MKHRLRTKFTLAFMVLTLLQVLLTVSIGYYCYHILHNALQKVDSARDGARISVKIQEILYKSIMPANDYLITGNKRFKDDFKQLSQELTSEMAAAEIHLARNEQVGINHTQIERDSLGEIRESWIIITKLSEKIFRVRNPIGDIEAARLMEEMDYTWGEKAVRSAQRWYESETNEYREAAKVAEDSLNKTWYTMILCSVMLTICGFVFAFFYSGHVARLVEIIQKNAGQIATGDFMKRVDIKTGDELQMLAESMNNMAGQLGTMYANLEGLVAERTSALEEAGNNLKIERDKLKQIFETMQDGVCIVNQTYDLEYVNPVIEREFGQINGRKCFEYLHDRNKACYWCPNEKVFSGEIIRMERYYLKNEKTYEVVDTPVINPDGTMSKLEIVRDITERKRAEEALKKHVDELELFRKVTIKREIRMKELKDRIQELEKQLRN